MAFDLPRHSKARIGCAGWAIPALHQSSFPGSGSALERYSSIFTAVEINSSFYRPHKRDTYQRWADTVPARFRFSVKVPQTITHDKHLKGVVSELRAFVGQAGGLGGKLGGVLVQLPPSLKFNRRVAGAFFERLKGELPVRAAVVCEPRHKSWFELPAIQLLRDYKVNRVGADPAPAPASDEPGTAGKWRYWRLHGSPRMYYSSYDTRMLEELAARVASVRSSLTPWIIFDNTAAGHAVGNALAFRALLSPSPNRLG